MSAARGLKILLVTPAPSGSRKGNRVTALRWAGLLRALGHRVRIAASYEDAPCDVLVALHANKSFESIERFHAEKPAAPLIVAMTGTDLYGDLEHDERALASIAIASRLVVLQPRGILALPDSAARKARVIRQSATRPHEVRAIGPGHMVAVVLAHLRAVKDPFRAALASRLLPAGSKIRIVHLGEALEPSARLEAEAKMAANPRYVWLGERPRREARAILAGSQLLVVSSILEGGANVVTEAIAAGVPVLSSRIEGSIGILGADYPGYFRATDTDELAALLLRAETDAAFVADLKARIRALEPLVDPSKEREAWRSLLEELAPTAC